MFSVLNGWYQYSDENCQTNKTWTECPSDKTTGAKEFLATVHTHGFPGMIFNGHYVAYQTNLKHFDLAYFSEVSSKNFVGCSLII